MGWALHESKGGGSRYSVNALENISLQITTLEEHSSGNNCDLQQVADDMINCKLANGERRFSREEFLSKAQIRSFFCRIRAVRR